MITSTQLEAKQDLKSDNEQMEAKYNCHAQARAYGDCIEKTITYMLSLRNGFTVTQRINVQPLPGPHQHVVDARRPPWWAISRSPNNYQRPNDGKGNDR